MAASGPHPAAGPGFEPQPWPVPKLMSFLAGHRDLDSRAAAGMPRHGRRPLGAGEVAIAPGHDREQDRDQLAPRAAEPVLVPLAFAGLAVRAALDEASLGQRGEPAGQNVARDSQVAG